MGDDYRQNLQSRFAKRNVDTNWLQYVKKRHHTFKSDAPLDTEARLWRGTAANINRFKRCPWKITTKVNEYKHKKSDGRLTVFKAEKRTVTRITNIALIFITVK